ncbi:hypothetical protein B0H17DRAFT_1200146 [Mycena rosella]|uniref:Uncharacterized protein n=1 Tax=Mycena rosella TaxID=1033263 RepID=A0AAD7DMK8_MYCRO|nr:hypothetical protein B0H17DRAFT_1200146 [Mycena rosella]
MSLGGLCVWRRRRRHREARLTRATSPFTLLPSNMPMAPVRASENSDVRSIGASAVRQQPLQHKLRAAQQKILARHRDMRLTRATSPFTLLPPNMPMAPAGAPDNSDARAIGTSAVRQQPRQNELRAPQENVLAGHREEARLTRATSPVTLLPPNMPMAPEDNSDGHSIGASTVRQQLLQNELRAAQEKIVDIEALERRTNAPQGSATGRILRMLSTRSAGAGMSELIERNGMLAARIRELEIQMNSPWALGLSDEPPPG